MCCWPSATSKHLWRRVLLLKLASLVMLGIAAALLYSSVVQETPWCQLVVQQDLLVVALPNTTKAGGSGAGLEGPGTGTQANTTESAGAPDQGDIATAITSTTTAATGSTVVDTATATTETGETETASTGTPTIEAITKAETITGAEELETGIATSSIAAAAATKTSAATETSAAKTIETSAERAMIAGRARVAEAATKSEKRATGEIEATTAPEAPINKAAVVAQGVTVTSITTNAPTAFLQPLSLVLDSPANKLSVAYAANNLIKSPPEIQYVHDVRRNLKTAAVAALLTTNLVNPYASFGEKFSLFSSSSSSYKEERNSSAIYISMVWYLRSVMITVPSFKMYNRKINIEELSNDAFIQTAMSFAGFYDSILDLQFITKLLDKLGFWTLVFCYIAYWYLLIILLASCIMSFCWKRRCNRGTDSLPEYDNDVAAYVLLPNEGVRSPSPSPSSQQEESSVRPSPQSSPLQVQQQPQQNENTSRILTIWYNTTTPSYFPFALVGSLSLIAIVCGSIGLSFWLTRGLSDANHLLLGVAKIVGIEATEWLANHSAFHLDVALIRYVSALIILGFTALINLSCDLRVKQLSGTEYQRNMAAAAGGAQNRIGVYEPPRL